MIIPAILTGSIKEAQHLISLLEQRAQWIHIDILDNTMVPGTTISPEEIKELKTTAKLGVHLMVDNPQQYMQALNNAAQVERVIVHTEAKEYIKTMQQEQNWRANLGIALQQETLYEEINNPTYIQIMSVQPGKQGNQYIETTPQHIQDIQRRYPDATIAIDGGITKERIPEVKEAGADILIVGSAIVSAEYPQEALQELISIEKEWYTEHNKTRLS